MTRNDDEIEVETGAGAAGTRYVRVPEATYRGLVGAAEQALTVLQAIPLVVPAEARLARALGQARQVPAES